MNREKAIEILEVALEGYVEECIPELDSEFWVLGFDEYKAEREELWAAWWTMVRLSANGELRLDEKKEARYRSNQTKSS